MALRKVHEAQREHGTHSQTLTRVAHQARRLVEKWVEGWGMGGETGDGCSG